MRADHAHGMKLVILGRDGTLNRYRDDHVKAPEELDPLPGAMEADLDRVSTESVLPVTNEEHLVPYFRVLSDQFASAPVTDSSHHEVYSRDHAISRSRLRFNAAPALDRHGPEGRREDCFDGSMQFPPRSTRPTSKDD